MCMEHVIRAEQAKEHFLKNCCWFFQNISLFFLVFVKKGEESRSTMEKQGYSKQID